MRGSADGRAMGAPKNWLSALVGLTVLPFCVAQEPQLPLKPGVESKLQWEECGEISNHTLQCAQLEVPMDHFHRSSDEKTFSIALIRMLATNASATGDRHIFLNPGGPGGSGVNFVLGAGANVNKLIGEEFHLLSFDPRGVNRSTPQALCYETSAQRINAFENIPWDLEFQAGEMYTKAENKAKACADIVGDHAQHINTPQTAADMNSILDAIGQEKMYYWGFSYGSLLGQTYAQMFPDRVARLTIDGVVNMDEWYNSFVFREYLTDTDRIFNGFIEECFKAGEACPLNSIKSQEFKSSKQLQEYIREYMEQLEEEPIPVYINSTNYGAITRRSLVTNGIFPALYKPALWPTLAENIAALINGNSTPAFDAYADSWVVPFLIDESGTFVIYNDNRKTGQDAPVHGIKAVKNYTASVPELSFLVSKYHGPDFFSHASWSIPTAHNFYPRYYPAFPRVKTAEPILVLSTTWDPVCPLVSAKKAKESFEGAGLVEQRSYGHCSLSMPSLCTAKYIKGYFHNGTLPEEGTVCQVDAGYFPPAGKPSASVLNEEDEELLASLHALAREGIMQVRGLHTVERFTA